MKKKLLLFISAILIIFLIYASFNKLTKFRILSFTRYFNGESTVNLLARKPSNNAKKYEIILYDEDGNEVFRDSTKENKLDIQAVPFSLNDRLLAKVTAIGADGRKLSADEYSAVWKEEFKKVEEVVSNRESGDVSGRKKITLSTVTNDAEIYYTTDGSVPTKDSKKYTKSIKLDKSMQIKAIAIKEGYQDSDISEFNYRVLSTKPIVYLSPSTQHYNEGIKGSGYTTEEEMMNKVADVVEDILLDNNIVVYRNKPSMTSKSSIKDSRKHDVDLHLAIHSNASPENKKGRYTGIETWIYDDSCTEAKMVAEKIQAALVSIYYNKYGDRGVLNSIEIGGLGETNPYNVNNGILIEVAFHDNWNDAKWITKNIKKIGTKIADAIIKYYK